MTENIVISIITLAGTMITAYAGIKKFSSLTDYKLNELTKKVEKHNNLVERMYCTEKKVEILSEKISVANHRISDLENIDK